MADKYKNFVDLAANETDGIDYRIEAIEKQSPIAVVAPHGGYIEIGTSKIATAIAGDEHSLYRFEGLKPGEDNCDLHITSTHFDEPNCFRIVALAEVVVGVHGRADRDDPETVWLGGRDEHLRQLVADELERGGFSAITEGHPLRGIKHENICNQGKSKAGVQLEIPLTLREKLEKDPSLLEGFATAVRNALGKYQ